MLVDSGRAVANTVANCSRISQDTFALNVAYYLWFIKIRLYCIERWDVELVGNDVVGNGHGPI